MTDGSGARAAGVAVSEGDPVRGNFVVDALGRYRCPPGWPRAGGEPADSGAIYYCRYFELAAGVEHLSGLGPRPAGPQARGGVVGGLRPDRAARRHDVGRVRTADHRRHADGWAHEREPDRRPGNVPVSSRLETPSVTRTRRSRTGSPLRLRMLRRSRGRRLKRRMSMRSRSATERMPAPRPASATSWPAPLTRRGAGVGAASRSRSRAGTAPIRSSRSRAPWPPHRTTTWFCGARSAASGCSTAQLSSTRTTPCTTGSRRSSASSRRTLRHRPAHRATSCWLGWRRPRQPYGASRTSGSAPTPTG